MDNRATESAGAEAVLRIAGVAEGGGDMRRLIATQEATIARLAATDAALRTTNGFAAARLDANAARIAAHVAALAALKADLDAVFRRVRILKAKAAKKYPQAYQEALSLSRDSRPTPDEDD
ncbi:hypothetical protein HK100_007283 [Physocladia obscura]|uniref:KxDL domain-containing protein n=1 Tax=Physocladia obscura TaxID=109957 RepID=A0AAD5SPJ6_9FUNG|nr:hypothetical protein HK100_007283 [Physocladia obscura]